MSWRGFYLFTVFLVVSFVFHCKALSYCSPYSSAGSSEFISCDIPTSICSSQYLSASTCPHLGGTFTGDTKLNLYVNNNLVGTYDDTSSYGLCSSIFDYYISTTTCVSVRIDQYCFSSACSGTTVYSLSTTPTPTTSPTFSPIATSITPSIAPTYNPSRQPNRQPSSQPTSLPTWQPTSQPSSQPTEQPSHQPSSQPTRLPSCQPSRKPTSQPSCRPSSQPSLQPTVQPSAQPSRQPSVQPSVQPTLQPSIQPSNQPTVHPSCQPSTQPISMPSSQPSMQPTIHPSSQPSTQPTARPSTQPFGQPSSQPTREPTTEPSIEPSMQPTKQPSSQPTSDPSLSPTIQPSMQPSNQPSSEPTAQPTSQPTLQPSSHPTCLPSSQPSRQPSLQPSAQPTRQPTNQPSEAPSMQPSRQPSTLPTVQPSSSPSKQPSAQPSAQPSLHPSPQPSARPSSQPSITPSLQPSCQPTSIPSRSPSNQPSIIPSGQPSCQPSIWPSSYPSSQPTSQSTSQPSRQPSFTPTEQPSSRPSTIPSCQPTIQPSLQPSRQPSRQPSCQPVSKPSQLPTQQPIGVPTSQPSSQPSTSPSRSISSELSDSLILKVKSISFDLEKEFTFSLAFSYATNTAGGPGSFLCADLLNISCHSTSSINCRNEEWINCVWTSSTALSLQSSSNLIGMSINQQIRSVTICLLPGSPLRALSDEVQVSHASVILPVRYRLRDSHVQDPTPKVTIVPEWRPAVKMLSLTIGYFPSSNLLKPRWSNCFAKVDVILEKTVELSPSSLLIAMRNLSSFSTLSLSRALQDLSSLVPIVIYLSDAYYSNFVKLWQLSNFKLQLNISITLCDEWNFCGTESTGVSVNASSLLSIGPTVPTLIVSISPFPVWNESCGTGVSILSHVVVSSDLGMVSSFDSVHLRYIWLIQTSSSNAFQVFATESKDPSLFRAPVSLSLDNNDYKLKLQVTNLLTGAVGESAPITLTCYFPSLKLNLFPAQRGFTIGIFDQFNITSIIAMDHGSSSKSYTFQWSCRSYRLIALGGNSLSGLSQSVRDRIALPNCLMNISAVSSWNSSVATLKAASRHSVNSTSEITVTMWDPLRLSRPPVSQTIEVRLTFASQPLIQLRTARTLLQRVNSQQNLLIKATILPMASSSPLSFQRSLPTSATWLLMSGSSRGSGVLQSMTDDNTTHFVFPLSSGEYSQIHLSLRANALMQNSYYWFRLMCENAVADVEVTTNALPFGGSINISPRSGWALETLYRLWAPNWRDVDGDYPLHYVFYVFEPPYQSVRAAETKSSGSWTPIPGHSDLWLLESLFLPPGPSSLSSLLPIRCLVTDSLGAVVEAANDTTVFPFRLNNQSNGTVMNFTNAGAEMLTTMLSLVETISSQSPLRTQQVTTVMAAMLRRDVLFTSLLGEHGLTTMQQLILASALTQALNTSLDATDVSQKPVVDSLMRNISQLIGDANVAIAKESSQSALNVLSSLKFGNQTTALTSQASILMSSLIANMLENSHGSLSQVVQVATDKIKLTAALMPIPSKSDSSIVFFPVLTIANSSTTLSIAQSATASGSATISVASYDASLFQGTPIGNSSSSGARNDGLPAPTLSSDVLSITIAYSNYAPGTVNVPSFVANMEVTNDDDFDAPYFEYNCTIGEPVHVSYLCPQTLVRMNLTCSGKSSANFRKRCPVPQRVCSVLRMTDLSVASDSFCHVSSNSDSSVTCSCGFGGASSSNNSTQGLSLLDSGGAIHVAVMTQFVAGDFGGTVVAGTGSIGANIAAKSTLIFVAFGLLWGFGFASMAALFFNIDFSRMVGLNDAVSPLPDATVNAKTLSKADGKVNGDRNSVLTAGKVKQMAYLSMKKYLVSVLPSIYHPVPWLRRLMQQMLHHHKYVSLFMFGFSAVKYFLPFGWKHRGDDEVAQFVRYEEKRKKTILQVAYMLSAVTLSCFTLSVLYDIQYPVDDGSCAQYQEEALCLQRKTLLDPARSYCAWNPSEQASAGWITSSRAGKLIESTSLESVLPHPTSSEVRCVYSDSDASGYVMLTVLLITTMVSLPVDVTLKYIFQLLAAKNDIEIKLRKHLRQTMQLKMSNSSTKGTARRVDRRGALQVDQHHQHQHHQHQHQLLTQLSSNKVGAELLGIVPAPESMFTTTIRRHVEGTLELFHLKESVKTASVVSSVRIARAECWERWLQLHDWHLYGGSPAKFHAMQTQLAQRLHRAVVATADSTMRKRSSKAQQDRLELLSKRLENATHDEFGMTIVQALYEDILDKETVIGDRFAKVMSKDFPIETYLSSTSQWVLTITVTCMVLGALFFVILKGSTRGPMWQSALLRICFLDWFVEVVVHQTFEVYFVHFVLPNLIFEDVQRTLAAMLRSSAALIHDVTRHHGAVAVGEWALRTSLLEQQTSMSSVLGGDQNRLLVTQQIVATSSEENRLLMESQVVMFFAPHRFFAVPDEWPRRVFTLPRSMNPMQRKIQACLFFVLGFDISWQRLVSGLLSSALFSAMSTMWFAMKNVQGSEGIMTVVVLFMAASMVMGLLHWHRRTLINYLGVNTTSCKIAAIVPAAAPSFDEGENEEEEESLANLSEDASSVLDTSFSTLSDSYADGRVGTESKDDDPNSLESSASTADHASFGAQRQASAGAFENVTAEEGVARPGDIAGRMTTSNSSDSLRSDLSWFDTNSSTTSPTSAALSPDWSSEEGSRRSNRSSRSSSSKSGNRSSSSSTRISSQSDLLDVEEQALLSRRERSVHAESVATLPDSLDRAASAAGATPVVVHSQALSPPTPRTIPEANAQHPEEEAADAAADLFASPDVYNLFDPNRLTWHDEPVLLPTDRTALSYMSYPYNESDCITNGVSPHGMMLLRPAMHSSDGFSGIFLSFLPDEPEFDLHQVDSMYRAALSEADSDQAS